MTAGDKRVVTREREILVTVGDAGAFAYTLNGREGRPLGAPGEVVSKRITLANLNEFVDSLMDVGLRSPLLDFFRRGEVAKDVRLLAARGALAPRAHEQLALLALLTEDGDPEVRGAAEATLAAIPSDSLAAFLGRSDVPEGLRDSSAAAGSSRSPARDAGDEPLVDTEPTPDPAAASGEEAEGEEASASGRGQRLALLNVAERMKAAMKGPRRSAPS